MKFAPDRRGFTLIELMIVVAIIGILAAVAIPKFAEMMRKSKEGSMKGRLTALRSALNIYHSNSENWLPTDNLDSLTPEYIEAIPTAVAPGYHGESAAVRNNNNFGLAGMFFIDDGGWLYWNWQGMPMQKRDWGSVWVACTHTDTKNMTITDW